MLGFESNWQNVTVDTCKMDIPLHGAAAVTCKMQTCERVNCQQVKPGPKFADHKCRCVGIKIHNNDLPGEGEIFLLGVGRIIGNCHFYIVLMGTLGVNISS